MLILLLGAKSRDIRRRRRVRRSDDFEDCRLTLISGSWVWWCNIIVIVIDVVVMLLKLLETRPMASHILYPSGFYELGCTNDMFGQEGVVYFNFLIARLIAAKK